MATEVDLQRLLVQMEASFVKYDRAWSKAMGQTDANVNRVKQRFDNMSKSISNAGANTARGLSPIAGQTGNIAAQFQDIAVQLQGGQSPFLIALQQGTQLSAVLSQAKSPIAALGAAFVQLVNPISLATIGAIALGGAAAQYLGTLLGDGKSATDVVKEQNDLIRKVAENWGDAVPALKAYVDELDRAAERSDLEGAISAATGRAFEGLRAQIPDLRAELAAARIDLQAFGAEAQTIDTLQAAFNDLARKVEDNTATGEDLDNVLSILAGTAGSETIPSMVNLAAVLASVRSSLDSAARSAAQFQADLVALNSARIRANAQDAFNTREFVAEQERLNGLTTEQLGLENEIARVREEAARADTTVTDQQALEIAQGRLAAEERRAQLARDGKSSASEAQREQKAVADLIVELEHELSLIGMTAEQKAVANALRRAGAAATDEQRAAIVNLVSATHAEQEALEATTEQMKLFADIGKSALSGFISDVLAGKDATEALGNALGNIGNRLLNAGLDGLFGGLFGGGGGLGGGWGIPGGFGRPGIFGIPGYASGTSDHPGGMARVFERGAEIIDLPRHTRVIPHELSKRMASGGGQGGFMIAPGAIQINGSGLDQQQMTDAIAEALDRFKRKVLPGEVNRLKGQSMVVNG